MKKILILRVLLALITFSSCRPVQEKTRELAVNFIRKQSESFFEKAKRQLLFKFNKLSKEKAERWVEYRLQSNANRIATDSIRRISADILYGIKDDMKTGNKGYKIRLKTYQNIALRSFEARFPANALKDLSSCDSILRSIK